MTYDHNEAFNRASHSDALREMQIVPFDHPTRPNRRLHPLVTSLWVAAGLLFVGHVVWVACGTPGL